MNLQKQNPPLPIPLTIVGGYLGAGKTTLVNHLLREAAGLRIAVLVNEFGALPIDADLIESQDGNVISISGGCVCCSYGDDLVTGLMDVAAMVPRLDHVILEASGVARPGGIAASVSLLPEFTLDGIVVLADAETIVEQSNDRYMGDTIEAQLDAADIVILNKADLVSDGIRSARFDWLEHRSGNVRVLAAAHARVPLEVVLGAATDPAQGGGPSRRSHEETAFEAESILPPESVDVDALAARLADKDLGLLRAKGFVRSRDGGTYTIQVVGRRWSVSAARSDARPGIVVIALPGQIRRDLLNNLFGSPSCR